MGIDPKIWGETFWIVIYDILRNADENCLEEFIFKLANILPCENCRQDFKDFLIEKKDELMINKGRNNFIVLMNEYGKNNLEKYKNTKINVKNLQDFIMYLGEAAEAREIESVCYVLGMLYEYAPKFINKESAEESAIIFKALTLTDMNKFKIQIILLIRMFTDKEIERSFGEFMKKIK